MPIGTAVGTILGAGQALGLDPIGRIGSGLDSIFGGSTPISCGQKQRQLANQINRLSVQDLNDIVRRHRQMFPGTDIRPSGNSIAREYYGGKDCRVSTQKGKRFQQFVRQRLQRVSRSSGGYGTGQRQSPGRKVNAKPQKTGFGTNLLGGNLSIVLLVLAGLGFFIYNQ